MSEGKKIRASISVVIDDDGDNIIQILSNLQNLLNKANEIGDANGYAKIGSRKFMLTGVKTAEVNSNPGNIISKNEDTSQ